MKLPGEITSRLIARGVRLTKPREEVLSILLQKRDHPTAGEVFLRVKKHRPSTSLATIYNCLEALVQSGLAKQVNLDRAPTRYCANLQEHGHFFCEGCGTVHDVAVNGRGPWELPEGFVLTHAEVVLRGRCRDCANNL